MTGFWEFNPIFLMCHNREGQSRGAIGGALGHTTAGAVAGVGGNPHRA